MFVLLDYGSSFFVASMVLWSSFSFFFSDQLVHWYWSYCGDLIEDSSLCFWSSSLQEFLEVVATVEYMTWAVYNSFAVSITIDIVAVPINIHGPPVLFVCDIPVPPFPSDIPLFPFVRNTHLTLFYFEHNTLVSLFSFENDILFFLFDVFLFSSFLLFYLFFCLIMIYFVFFYVLLFSSFHACSSHTLFVVQQSESMETISPSFVSFWVMFAPHVTFHLGVGLEFNKLEVYKWNQKCIDYLENTCASSSYQDIHSLYSIYHCLNP